MRNIAQPSPYFAIWSCTFHLINRFNAKRFYSNFHKNKGFILHLTKMMNKRLFVLLQFCIIIRSSQALRRRRCRRGGYRWELYFFLFTKHIVTGRVQHWSQEGKKSSSIHLNKISPRRKDILKLLSQSQFLNAHYVTLY